MTRSSKGGWTDPNAQGLNSPFASLRSIAPEPVATPPAAAPPVSASRPAPRRAVVRCERKGRGGKTVTVISHTGLDPHALSDWCARMRKALGVGGAIEGEDIVLQGDLRERTTDWLKAAGIERVTNG
jgi:translation initiation factor 1